jgi:hypothetical protein
VRPAKGATELGAFAQAMRFQRGNRWLFGGGLRFDYAPSWYCFGLDGSLATSSERDELGSVRTLLAQMSPYAGWHGARGPASARVGAGYTLGVARITGASADPRTLPDRVTGFFGSPYGFADVALAATPFLSFGLRGRAGWVTAADVGLVEQGASVELKGLWTSFELGVALAF